MKYTAQAPANIAFIKYWGKRDEGLRLPLNASISMNLSDAYTTTTVEFSDQNAQDRIEMIDEQMSEKEKDRICKHLDRIREAAGVQTKARVVTKNSFPKGTGAASSASGFAALTLSASKASGLSLNEKELTVLARLGSGSAARSIPDGFVIWEEGGSSEDSYAYSLFPHTHWDIRDVLVIVQSGMKNVSTTRGMREVHTSPKLVSRLDQLSRRIEVVESALRKKDFKTLGEVVEDDCLDMHAVMQSQNPPLNYWNTKTIEVMEFAQRLRIDGLAVYFTIDAGPNVHLIMEGKDQKNILQRLQTIEGIEHIMCNKPAAGAHIINTHLF